MKKMLIVVSIFFSLVFGWYGAKKIMFMWFFAHYHPPAVTISATTVKNQPWQSYFTAVGTLTAINGVDISPEVAGIVEQINFTSGQFVKKNEPIIVLRNDVEQANLKSSLARLQLAQINYDREKTLFNKHATSQAQVDASYAELLEAEGNVESIKAHIKQKNITAPFDGKLGIRQVNVGQFVSPNSNLVTLQSLNPLNVIFSVPEQNLSHLTIGQEIDVSVNIGKGDTIVKGKITAINAKIEPATRTISVEAIVQNTNNQLFPGMYGLVRIWLPGQPNMIVVPQTAISYSLSGDYVFLLTPQQMSDKPGSKPVLADQLFAHRQFVKIGERRGRDVTIVDGLKAGDQVVTSGQLKLQNGTEVHINNRVTL